MDTLKLKAFLEIDKHGSFTKAADEFNYTPSALSHMADGLEKEMGVKLFVRTHQGVSLTEHGKELKNKIRALVVAEEALENAIEKIKKGETIRISAYASVANYLLPELIKEYKNLNEHARFSIEVVDCMSASFKKNNSDVYIGDLNGFNQETKFFAILQDRYVAVVPKDEFKNRKVVTKEDLYNHVFIKTNETLLENEFDYSRFKEVVNYTSVEDFSLINMVSQKIGVTVTNELVTKGRLQGVKVLPVVPDLYRTLAVGYSSESLSQASKNFVEFLREKYRKNY